MSASAPHNEEVHSAMQTAYGLFMLAWSTFETILEVAIARQLGIDFLRGNIVTSGLQFQRRAGILRSLLALHGEQHAEAIKLINAITQEASRNALVHGMVFTGEEHLTFVRRDTADAFKATRKTFSLTEIFEHVSSINSKIEKVQGLLGVSDDDLQEFGTTALNLAKISSTSPQQPASKSSK